MPREIKKDDLYVVIIETEEERKTLHDLCVKYDIPILYPELFDEEEPLTCHLFGVSESGVGLVGTMVARFTPKDHILHLSNGLEKIEGILHSLKFIHN